MGPHPRTSEAVDGPSARRVRCMIESSGAAGLRWLFLLILFGGVLAIHEITETDGKVSSPGAIARLLSPDPPERPQWGYVHPPEPPPAPAPAAKPAEPAPEPTAAPPTPVPDRFQVAKTDGLGLAFYAAPRREARLRRGLAEGAQVTVLERVGTDWARVRADDGQEGWVGAAYLLPAAASCSDGAPARRSSPSAVCLGY